MRVLQQHTVDGAFESNLVGNIVMHGKTMVRECRLGGEHNGHLRAQRWQAETAEIWLHKQTKTQK
jgi:hypothetical protein